MGIVFSLVFGSAHAHWLKRLHLNQFLGDISRKFRKYVFLLKKIIKVFLRETVLHLLCKFAKLSGWIESMFGLGWWWFDVK